MPEESKVLCFGEALWDILPGAKIPGGAPLNVALRLVQLGIDARLLSRVGNDQPGRELLGFLRSRGMSTENIQVDDQHPTGSVSVDTSDPKAASYEIAERVAWDFIDAKQYFALAARDVDVLVFGSLAARSKTSRQSLMRLLDRSRLKVFDVNFRPPFIDRTVTEMLLRRANWVKLNELELEEIGTWHGFVDGVAATADAIREIYDIEMLCVTLGDEGAILLHLEHIYRQPAFAVDVVDTVGCGDAFMGSWISELLKGTPAQDALRCAAATGAVVATNEGANSAISNGRVALLMARLD